LYRYDIWIFLMFPTTAFAHYAQNGPIAVVDRQMSPLAANLPHNIIFAVAHARLG
jgi:hypothetical protein